MIRVEHFESQMHKLKIRRLPDGQLQVHDWAGSIDAWEITEQQDVDALVLSILENPQSTHATLF